MKIRRMTAAVLSALLAISCSGCAAVTDLMEEHNIKIPFLTGSGQENAQEGKTGDASAASTAAETASEQEPQEELSPEEVRRQSEGKVLNIFCWDESLESLFIMYYPGYEDLEDRKGRIAFDLADPAECDEDLAALLRRSLFRLVPRPKADLTLPRSREPASVTPRCSGRSVRSAASR